MFVSSKSLMFLAAAATTANAQVTFEEVSDLLGPFSYGPAALRTTVTDSSLAGIAWFDYDNDGYLDVFICSGTTKSNALFKGDGNGGFTDVTAQAGLTNNAGCLGLIAADLDNDGYMDLFLSPDLLQEPGLFVYKNNGDGTFSDMTALSGLQQINGGFGIASGDYDNDGYLDIYWATLADRADILFKNNGDFTFTDVSDAAGIDSTMLLSCSAVFGDFNNDMNADIVVGGCGGQIPTYMYVNNGDGTFAAPVAIGPAIFGMGIGIADINNDGALDLLITGAGGYVLNDPHQLLINNGDGTFTQSTTSGIPTNDFGWSAAFVDFDNDRNQDLAFTGSGINPFLINFNKGRLLFGDGSGSFTEAPQCGPTDCTACSPFGPFPPPDGAFRQLIHLCYLEGRGCAARDLSTGLWSGEEYAFCNAHTMCDGCYRDSPCSIQTAAEAACVPSLGVELSSSRTTTVAVADYDNDGFDDIAIMSAEYSTDHNTLFGESLVAPGAIDNVILLHNNGESGYNSFRVKLAGTSGNRNGVGSKLKVTDDAGYVQYEEARAVFSPNSSAQEYISFGLGTSTNAALEITWSRSGNMEKFCLAAGDRTIITEGEGRSLNGKCPFENGTGGSAGTSSGGSGNGNRNGNSLNNPDNVNTFGGRGLRA